MEIINKRGEIKLNKWVEKVKDSHQMGLHVCSKLMHVLLECAPLHEQGPMCDVIMLLEMG